MFTVLNELPINIAHSDSVKLEVKFKPYGEGYFEDRLNIRCVNDTLLLGQQVDLFGSSNIVTVEDNNNGPINAYSLFQNYPNPFNPGTTIRYTIPTQSTVSIKVYNSIGENIADLINSFHSAGSYEVSWYAGEVASGIYFYSIKAIPTDGTEYFYSVKKMILLK